MDDPRNGVSSDFLGRRQVVIAIEWSDTG